MVRLIILCLFLVFSFSGFGMEDENEALKAKLMGSYQTYGSIQNKEAKTETYDLIALDETFDIGLPEPSRILFPPEIWRVILADLSPRDQFNMLQTARYFYEIVYPHDMIALTLREHFSNAKAVDFADRIPNALHKVVKFVKNTQRYRRQHLLGPFKDDIHTIIEIIECYQFTPTFMASNARADLDYLIQIEEKMTRTEEGGLVPQNRPKSSANFRTCFKSYLWDRRFMAGAGLLTLGGLIVGGYFISTEQVQGQAYTIFMNQTQISSFRNYDFRYDYWPEIPSCFEQCTDLFGAIFYSNPPVCNISNGRDACFCGFQPNQSCYDESFGVRVNGNLSQWFDYLASRCGLAPGPSDYWPNFLQEIVNHTRTVSNPSDIFTCAPNPDGKNITCGVSTLFTGNSYGNSLTLYLYNGMAQCAAKQAWSQHLVSYFVPSTLFMIAAIVGVLSYWHFC